MIWSHCLQLHLLPVSLGPLALVLCMAHQVHSFEAVRYVPIKVIRHPEWQWLSAGGLSKQMALNNYKKSKPAHIGVCAEPRQATSCDSERCFSSLNG